MSGLTATRAEPASPDTLRDVRRGVAEAADAQVLQVVRMVDALAERGATDRVLDAVRPRLRAIQPARPLRFARLLFLPLDPLIVPPAQWRAGTPFVPRTAIAVLAQIVRVLIADAGEQACLDEVDATIAAADTHQTAIIRRAGSLLWPRAATALGILREAPAPVLQPCLASWTASGLNAGELLPQAACLRPVLSAALALHDHDHGGAKLSEEALLALLRGTEAAGTRACITMLSLLLIRVPQAAPALLTAAQKLRSLRATTEEAAETALSWVEAEVADQTRVIGDAAAVDVMRQAALLDALTEQTAPGVRRRVAQARGHLLSGSLSRFETSLRDQVAGPLAQLPQDPAARDAALDALEATARTLRRFEVEARRLGATEKFDALVARALEAARRADGMTDMDRARLVEIMAGPDAAAFWLRS